MEKKIEEFEINELVKITYNKIAQWHNENPNETELKILTIELIEEIAGAAFTHLGLTFNQGVQMSENVKNHIQKIKEKKIPLQQESNHLTHLSDEELMLELEKRKNQFNKLNNG